MNDERRHGKVTKGSCKALEHVRKRTQFVLYCCCGGSRALKRQRLEHVTLATEIPLEFNESPDKRSYIQGQKSDIENSRDYGGSESSSAKCIEKGALKA